MPLSLFSSPRAPSALPVMATPCVADFHTWIGNVTGWIPLLYTNHGVTQTMISLTGSGVMGGLCWLPSTYAGNTSVEITVDNTIVYTSTAALADLKIMNCIGCVAQNSLEETVVSLGYVPFNSSFKMDINVNVNVGVAYQYYMT